MTGEKWEVLPVSFISDDAALSLDYSFTHLWIGVAAVGALVGAAGRGVREEPGRDDGEAGVLFQGILARGGNNGFGLETERG